MTTTATAMEFQRKFGEYQHRARKGPVEITRHGRRELVLMSAEQYDELLAKTLRTASQIRAERAQIGKPRTRRT